MSAGAPEALVLRGLSPRELRERARSRFDERFGEGCWRLCGERTRPCLVSIGGRVRVYQWRFGAGPADLPTARDPPTSPTASPGVRPPPITYTRPPAAATPRPWRGVGRS